jgi:hypothetical protein
MPLDVRERAETIQLQFEEEIRMSKGSRIRSSRMGE